MISILCPECWKEEFHDYEPIERFATCPDCGEKFDIKANSVAVDESESE